MPQVQLINFETRVWGRLENNQEFYPKEEVDRLINEGSRVVNLFTGFNQDSVTLGLSVKNWLFYRVPTSVVFPMKVYVDKQEMIKNNLQGISGTRPKWFRGVPGRPSGWTPIGSRMFSLTPPDQIGGRFIEVLGVLTPGLLINPTDTLTLDDTFAQLIENYAVMNLTLKEGGKVFTDASREYNSWMKKVREVGRWTTTINPRFWIETEES